MILVPKGWHSFQHYKNRNPPWIKLHKSILDDYDFQGLPLASKALAPMLWLLASESMEGEIKWNCTKIAFRLRWVEADLDKAIKPLISLGFFECLPDASNALETRKQLAIPETETETEEETETETEKTRSSPSARIISLWNEKTEGKLAQAKLTPKRDKIIRPLLRDESFEEDFTKACSFLMATPFYLGKNDRGWMASLDWLLKPGKVTELAEKAVGPKATNGKRTHEADAAFSEQLKGIHIPTLEELNHAD